MSDADKQHRHNNIFTISAHAAFLPSFAHALVKGKIIKDYVKNGNLQQALSQTIIYVPTRRAERALRLCFAELNPALASFLPDIRAIGDSDEDSDFYHNFSDDAEQQPPKLSDITRLTNLAKLIQPWRKNLPKYLQDLYQNENDKNSEQNSSMADALWLAQDLIKLIDEVETEGGDWSQLPEIAKDDIAEWWQITLEFLKIIDQYCPQLLQDQIPISHAAWRNKTLEKTAEFLQNTKPEQPIIVLGSTGSIPAVAHLMQVISKLKNGAIILPNLDLTMDNEQWQNLEHAENDISLYGHPQYCLKQLLAKLQIDRSQVIELAEKTTLSTPLKQIISETMRVADTTDVWVHLKRDDFAKACENFTLIEAANEREEALSIAVALRQAIEDKDKTAAFVTTNRYLARRVVAELQRFGIKANDSGGIPLAQTLAASLLRLIIEFIFNPHDVVALLSLLKHPLAKFSHQENFNKTTIEQFELFILRGCVGRITLDNLDNFILQRLEVFSNDARYDTLNKQEIIQKLTTLKDSFLHAIMPLQKIIKTKKTSNLTAMAAATIATLDNIINPENPIFSHFQHEEAITALKEFLQDLLTYGDDFEFFISEWPRILLAFMNLRSVSPSVGGHPRLSIWGTLESRLQTVDTVIIGDLNEGSFPAKQKNDPFLSRQMKMTIKLAPPEKRIGLAAHDFQCLIHNKQVILSRANRVDNAPSVPSRWLQRLTTVLGQDACQKMQKRGNIYIQWAKQLEKCDNLAFVKQPCPKPPIEARPAQFSVTEIEVLRRDPYAIYAKKILQLKPLDALIRDPDIAERGTLYHAIMADMIINKIDMQAATALQDLLDVARKQFAQSKLPQDVEALWWPRFELLAPQIITYQQSLTQRQSFVEISAQATEIGKTGVSLLGRADRIDIIGTMAEIIDYKTGSTPTKKQAASLISPQLALEAALLHRNAFIAIEKSNAFIASEKSNAFIAIEKSNAFIAIEKSNAFGAMKEVKALELTYIRLKDKGELITDNICETAKKTAYDLAEEAWARLTELIEYYQKPQTGYLSRAMPPIVNYESDYDHLARVLEWSLVEDSSDNNIGES